METELDITESLEALCYNGQCIKNDILCKALGGPKQPEFQELIGWLTNEIHVLRKTDEKVTVGVNDNDFSMELSAMLKELGCPYSQFVGGPLSERFESRNACMLLIEYLTTELMATKMSLRLRPEKQKYFIISQTETNTAKALEHLTRDLGLNNPPQNVSPKALFDKLNFKVEERLRTMKSTVLCEPLLGTPKQLTDSQWKKLEIMYSNLESEYNLRRQMLLTRLEVTIQSFQWSDKMITRKRNITERYQDKMKELAQLKQGGDATNIVALLASRSDLAIIEKTSSANLRKNTASKIQKHIIGNVPDRGGRAHEHAPPPPEMPSWQQQRASGPPGGFDGSGKGGGRGAGRGAGRGGGGGNWQPSKQLGQRSQFNRNNDANWISGSGRVQGTGWSDNNSGSSSFGHSGYGGSGCYNNDSDRPGNTCYTGGHSGRNGRDSDGSYRGRSNYNRGSAGSGGKRR